MKKVVLIFHGWPQPITKRSEYYRYFKNNGYDVIAPKLFSDEFKLNLPEIKTYIKKLLGNRKPDVIVGISMGGLIVPNVAVEYPKSKLVFIASGAVLKPKSKIFKHILKTADCKYFLRIVDFVKLVPKEILFVFYKLINPFRGNSSQRVIYGRDMKDNFKYILQISGQKEREVVRFVTSVDNSEILKNFKNQSIIFTSDNDLMMPAELGLNLHKLLSNSKLVKSEGGHFDVFTKENFKDLDGFLK